MREAYFASTLSTWVGKTCAGVQLHVTDPRAFDPMRTYLLYKQVRGGAG